VLLVWYLAQDAAEGAGMQIQAWQAAVQQQRNAAKSLWLAYVLAGCVIQAGVAAP
jgi:hypothetical protein